MIEPRLPGAVEFAVAAEKLGVDSMWIPEVWGYDALTGLAYLAAKTATLRLGTFVVQLGSRSPAMLATSALSLQELSGGRFMLGVGTSGPRVMEGWHGVRFRKPIEATRETIEIIRIVSRVEVAPVAVEFHDDDASAAAAARKHADGYAFTIGAMGTGGRNFHNDAFTRLGYGDHVAAVAELWQAGRRHEARAAVPIDLGRLTNLVDTAERIAERVPTYRAAGITTLLAKLDGEYAHQLATLERLLDAVNDG